MEVTIPNATLALKEHHTPIQKMDITVLIMELERATSDGRLYK